MPPSPAPVPSCDSLYVSPHADDVALSCAARIAAERAAGLRVAVVALFGPAPEEDGYERRWREAWSAAGVECRGLGLPEAARRDPAYAGFGALTEGRQPGDATWLGRAAGALHDLAWTTRARHVYVPLGVGAHVDHRLAHEAALRAFRGGDGRNVFLYEERPEALVPGAVRVRLAHLGAWLPPAASASADDGGLGRFLRSFHLPPVLRGDLRGWSAPVRAAGVASRLWRASRAWVPARGLGPRLQPVVLPLPAAAREAGRALAAAFAGPAALRRPLAARLQRLEARYEWRLAPEPSERFWLLLPSRDEAGRPPLAAGADDAAIA